MHITEIPKNSDITIIASINSNYLEFSSRVIDKKDEAIIIEAITNEEGKLISIASDKLQVDISFVEDEDKSPFIWKKIKSKLVKIKNVPYHIIWQSEEGKRQNRRGAFRLFIGEKAQLNAISKHSNDEVILKDISTTGFAFTCITELEIGKSCTIGCVIDNSTLVLSGVIVRKQVLENGITVYGCKLNKFSKELEKFIAKKQREEINRKMSR